jgi:hypothetical protein
MALAALVLAVLTLGPGLDGLLCRDEGGLSAAAATLAVAAEAGPDGQDEDHTPGPPHQDACLHGHCHHASPYVDAARVATDRPPRLAAVDHALQPASPPASQPTSGLKRPPRA